VATRTYNLSWMRQYKASTNSYYGSGSPIRVGGSANYQSFLGIPTTVRDALKTSKTSTTMKLKIYITDASSEWDVGRHKESGGSEPTYTTMPWYNYLKAVHYSGTGWLTIDLTSDFMNDYKNGVYQGLVLYSGASSSYYGEASNSGSTRAVIEITGDWNDPPNQPTITYPKGGEIIDTSLKIQWTSGGDPDGDSLKFQTAINDGTGWTYSAWSGYGATYMNWDMSVFAETSNAQIAVRAQDPSGATSAWTYSNKFTISHNQAPTAPTQLSPVNGEILDRTQVIRFSWKHNDDGAQAGFRIAWRTVASDGTRGAWNYIPSATGFMNTTNQYYNMPANTLPFGDIEWTVQTKDQQGLESPYATYQIVKASEPTDAPTILSPANQSTINTTRVTVKWSSLNQLEYELILYDTNGVQLWSEQKASGVKTVEIPVDLTNNTWYEVHLRVKDSVTLIWSSYTVHSFGTAFTPPLPPVIERFESAGEGIVNVFYGASDVNILPDFLVNQAEKNPILTHYDTTTTSEYTLLGVDSVQINGASKGVEFWLKAEHIPLIEGATYTLTSNMDVKGGRLFIGAYDASRASLGLNATAVNMADTPTGQVSLDFVLPAGTVELRLIFYTTWDNTNVVTHSGVTLKIQAQTATDRIEMFRREYTSTGTAPWIKIGTNLSRSGAFLDYTPASGIIYEYKAQAVSDVNNTSAESDIKTNSIEFKTTFIQEAHNLSNLVSLQFATSRETELEVENQLQQFAGRRDPVREYGEHETLTIQVEWEVDSYADVMYLRDMLRRRDILLYRDHLGRRYWVTFGKLSVNDKVVNGFVMSAEFTVTSYEEDLDKQREEELI
jgi:hypothetical protein